ncbi:MAG: ribonuclease-3 [Saprospiraceae bacterium]|jgi:ribonuclease-3|tara:strand:+ start:1011 stop:1691 length:681 start_codon:yes stop_codon:yes gene_type:complete
MNTTKAQLINRIGYDFSDLSLLNLALSHRSVGASNNERLEFLGDAALNFIIAHAVYQLLPGSKEGELSRYRADLVRGTTLTEIANELQTGNHLLLGDGEIKSGGRTRSSILANSVEAIIGAIYLDGGMDSCRICVLKWFDSRLKNLKANGQKDPKTQLQELMQAHSGSLPTYKVVKISGEAHDQTFTIECSAEGLKKPTIGIGETRRDAEKKAAARAMMELSNDQR